MNLQNLTFMISLLDRVTGPAGKLLKTMDTVTGKIQSGYQKIGLGVAGVAGAGFSLDNLLAPTKEIQGALGEVKSLGVADDVLGKLTKTALSFSAQYGESATEFVRASYDIQSAIAGLSGDELPAFTRASALLAKGTKADITTITDYVGTAYNIFQQTADQLGRAQWVDLLAGQTAEAVRIFKTTGKGMADAFSSLGANAATANVPMSEQISILGKLQATMSGSEAGTKFRAFLDGVGKAQEELNLQFTDAQGHLLPIVTILERLKGKYGDLGKVATSDLVKKAFGTQEAVAFIKLLSGDIAGLKTNISDIGNVKGLNQLSIMAQATTQSWDRASKGIEAFKIGIGTLLLPEINKFFNAISAGTETVLRWINLFPNLSRYVGLAVVGIFGIIAAVSALSIVMGAATLISGGFAAIWALITSPITLTIAALYVLLEAWSRWTYGLSIFDALALGYQSAVTQMTAFIESVAGATQFVIDKFNGLKEWFRNFNLWEFLLSGVDALIGKINQIPGVNIDLGGSASRAPAPVPTPGGRQSSGGLLQKISQSTSNQNSNRSIGAVNIYPQNKTSLSGLVDDLMMAGG